MWQWIGSICILCGSTGIACCFCREYGKRLNEMKNMKKIYQMFQTEVSYSKAVIPEACERIAGKLEEPLKSAFLKISEQMNQQTGVEFATVWRQEIQKGLADSLLTGRDQEILLRFPECMGYLEGQAQADAMEQFLHETDLRIRELEEERRNKC